MKKKHHKHRDRHESRPNYIATTPGRLSHIERPGSPGVSLCGFNLGAKRTETKLAPEPGRVCAKCFWSQKHMRKENQ